MFFSSPAAPKPPQDGPRPPQDVPKTAPRCPKSGQRAPHGPRSTQDRPRATQDHPRRPKSDPRSSKTAPRPPKSDFTSFPQAKTAPRGSKINLSEQEREARYILGPLSDIVGALDCLLYQQCNATTREGDKMSR